jgi:hypothetical protein
MTVVSIEVVLRQHSNMSRRQFMTSLTALYSHEFRNSKPESDEPQNECVARAEKGSVSASKNQFCSRAIMTLLPSVSVLRWGETPTLFGALERANLNHWTTDEVRKPINSVCYTPPSEPYRN